ncbi:MAG: PHP domain-containing protein [Dehalococcoidales bacterium]|nr:PHP domain-containing protein [Dehalococcoidales bacterium]
MSQVDLHFHSTASDGKHTPAELVKKAAEKGLKVISLTDHDSIEGVAPALEAAKAYPDLTLIPGVEISTDLPDGEAHILGYFIDYNDPDFKKELARFRDSRTGRGKRMVEKLNELGAKIEWSRVQEIAGDGSIGRPHVAQAMLEKRFVKTFEEAFERYIGHGAPAYVEREKMTPQEAVKLILRAKGIPVLAHPFTVKDPEAMAKALKEAGLMGIEAYYKDNTPAVTNSTLELAQKYGLIATGGTDYHGINKNEVMLGGTDVPLEAAEKLITLGKTPH